jgi:hypothetical protein
MNTTRAHNLMAAAVVGALAFIPGCAHTKQKPAPSVEVKTSAAARVADTIYIGGNIITVNDAQPSAEALAVKDGKILAVGTKADVLELKVDATKVGDLAGKTLIPGFVDAHSHFSIVGLQAIAANLLPAPDGPVNTIPALQRALRGYIATSPIPEAHHVVISLISKCRRAKTKTTGRC